MGNPLRRVPGSVRWSLVLLVIVVALIIAIIPRGDGDDSTASSGATAAAQSGSDRPASPKDIADARAAAGLQPCPSPSVAPPDSAFKGLVVPCLGGGPDVDLAAALTGVPTILNVWATWCEPCRKELPIFQQYSERVGDRARVLTMQSPRGAVNEDVALAFLADTHVTLPAVDDRDGRVTAQLKLPPYFPITVFVRADGTIAKIHPGPFASVDELARDTKAQLGVDA